MGKKILGKTIFTKKFMKTILDINVTLYTPVPFKMCKSTT